MMMIAPWTNDPAALNGLTELLRGRRIMVLAGAGCSTESGIPDYRGPNSGSRTRKPIEYGEFVGSEAARVRYWSRSGIGWPRVERAEPNLAHTAIARMETGGLVTGVVTQNVDGLHAKAGSRRVVELHGSLAWVRCLECGSRVSRAEQQERLLSYNALWAELVTAAPVGGSVSSAPDGDAELDASTLDGFVVPACDRCGGILKPDVVFFGENVPRERVDAAWRLLAGAEAVLVVGSSLTVYSGRRFIYAAQKEGKPIGIINIGPTRADEMAAAKVEGRLSIVLPQLAETLLGGVKGDQRV